jgi:hypothetical protein
MRGYTFFQGAVLVGLGLTFAGCAKSTPAPEDPSTVDPSSEQKSDSEMAASQSAGSHSLDVGMEFEDKGDDNARRAHHDAPPTASWKPVEKEKAADPKKPTATAAR